MTWLNNLSSDIIGLFFPQRCKVCSNRLNSQEKFICLSCWIDLPTVDNHSYKFDKIFWGKAEIEQVVSLFEYRAGSKYQNIIREIKYHGDKALGIEMGRRLATICLNEGLLTDIDIIIPVPLHKNKLRKRTFNQSEKIAKGLSEKMNIKVNKDILKRKKFTSTQTKKSKYERWENVKDAFIITGDQNELINKHILLVDDVLTTGSTLEACAKVLLEIDGTKISVATLAVSVL